MKWVALLIAGLLAFSAPANAAISFVNAADLGNNNSSTTSLTTAYTASTGSSVLYVVVVGDRLGGHDDVTGVTYGGASGVLQLSDSAGISGAPPSNLYRYIYAIFSPLSGSNNVVVSASNTHFLAAGVAEYKLSVLSGPPDSTSKTNGGVANSVTGSTSVVAANAWTFAMGHQNDNAHAWTAGTGDTLRTQDGTYNSWAIFDSNGTVTPGPYSMTASVGGTADTDIILDMLSFAPDLHIQGVVGTYTASTGQTSAAATLPATVPAGDAVIGAVVWIEDTGTSSHLSSITDDKGNSYTLLDAPTNGSGRFFQSFVDANIGNGPITITANYSGGTVGFTQVILDDYTGVRSFSGHNGTNAQATSATSGSFSSIGSNAVIWGADINSSGTASSEAAGSGFTQREYDSTAGNWNLISEDQVLATAGSTASIFTRSSNLFGDTVGVALEMSGSRRSLMHVGQ